MMDISNFLVVFNSATNFLVYWNSDPRQRSLSSGANNGTNNTDIKYTGAKTSKSLITDFFSHDEVDLLSRTYFDLWCKPEEESGLNLGHRILLTFLEVKPELVNNFGLNMTSEDWPSSPSVLKLGDQFGKFIGSLISGDRRGSLVTESRNFGRYHYELGKHIFEKSCNKVLNG